MSEEMKGEKDIYIYNKRPTLLNRKVSVERIAWMRGTYLYVSYVCIMHKEKHRRMVVIMVVVS
jgi:hypothetical protein